jgi:trimeric autotransporter adhesin
MNRNYRLVFNRSVQAWQAVAEFARACGKSKSESQHRSTVATSLPKLKKLAICIALGQVSGIAYALPSGADVQFGQATFQTTGNNLSINQGTKQLIANWQSFGIAANESVQMLQPNQGVALFRVVGPEASQIYGSLSTTGSLFLINPNGVLFGQGARVDVGNLVATSMNISNTDFLNGHYQFNADGSTGSVINQGVIKASDGGYIVLLGNEVKNSGTLTANNGSVIMGSAQSAMLDFYGNGLVKARLSGDALNALVEQAGSIQADGGAVQLATNSRSSAVNVSGVVQANSLVERNGVIRLEGGDNAKVSVSGNLSAAGNKTGTTGGRIEVTGEQVALFKGAKLDASGDAGGGTVLVGGDYQGKNTQIQNARTNYVDKEATISADAMRYGDGGKVIVWADEITRYYGNISAKGGTHGGNGGFVEVSGKRLLNFLGKVDLSATQGVGGNLLLDPTNITLSTGADANTTGFTSPGDINEAFADDAGLNSVFNVNAGGSFAGIAAGSTITLQATNNITVSNAFNVATATGSVNNSLVLQANNNIAVNAAVTTTGTGFITMNANADNTGGGNLAIGANIASQAGGIALTGANITRSAGNITSTGAADGNAGNINIVGTGAVNLGTATVTANGGTTSAGSVGRSGGIITMSGAGVTTTGAISASGSNGNGANQIGGNAGSVTINSTNGISTGAITSSGGNAGTGIANGGNAGTITLTNNTAGNIATGALTARTGSAIGTGIGGVIGAINVANNASGTLTTGALSTAGANNGNGGIINLTTVSGNITTTAISTSGGTALTGNAGRNAGVININSGGTVNTTTVAANGSAGVGVSQNGGNAASITITGKGGITTTSVAASGGAGSTTLANGGSAAAINISNSVSGNIGVTTLNANAGNAFGTGVGGAAGSVTLNNTAAAGNITTTNISTAGGTNAHGGNVLLSSAAGVTVAGTINTNGAAAGTGVTAAGRNAGNVTISGVNRTITGNITANGASALGTNQAGGNAGAVSIIGTGTLGTAAINAQTGGATGTGTGGTAGGITLNGTTVTAGALTTTGAANGNGGTISLTSTSGILSVGTIASSGGTALAGTSGRNAGAIILNSAGTLTAAAITANGTNGTAAGNQNGGNGATVNVTSTGGAVTVGAISSIGGNAAGTNVNGGNGGVVTLDAGGATPTITMANVTTTGGNRVGAGIAGVGGNLSVADAALLSAATTITTTGGSAGVGAGGAVSFAGTVNSSGANRALTINSNATTTFGSSLGNTLALASLTTNATGTTIINGGAVTTTGAQTYNDNVTLGAATTFTTTNSNVTFGGSINAATNNVIIAAGTGVVTANNAANNFGNLVITAGSANIRDTNAIVLGATNVSGNYTLRTAGAVTQSAAVTIGGATSITAGATNDVTLNNTANNFNSVAIVSGRDVNLVDANALTVSASSVRTIAAQTLSNDLTLGGAITATGTGSGTSIRLASAQNFINAGNFGLTSGVGSRWLVYSTSPTADTRGAGLIAASNFKQYNAVLGDTILGAGNGFVYSVAPTITASLSGVASKVYDGTITASIAGLTLGQSGAIDGDTVNLSALTNATYDDKNAGTGKTVTSNALTISGATNGAKTVFGYTLASPNGTGNIGTINQRAITVSAATDTKTYDGNNGSVGSPTLTSGSIVAGDFATFNQTFDTKNAGTGKTLTATGAVTDGNGGGNYAVTFVTDNTGVIDPLAITGSITANNKTYDGNNTATIATRSLAGVIIGDTVSYTGGTATFDNKNVGIGKTVMATGLGLSGADAGNYTVNTTASTTADIAKADITAVTGITANNKVYDATTTASLNTGAAAFAGMIGGDNLNVATATGNFADVNAGVGKTVNVSGISLGGGDAGNYNLLSSTTSTTADISQRPITITADLGQNKLFGNPDPLPFTFAVGGLGLVGGDTFTGALDRLPGETVGNYAINQGTLDAGTNYTINYIGNTFAILAPGNGSPRNAAGLGSLLALNDRPLQGLSILNVAAPAAGGDADVENSGEACEANTNPKLNNPNNSIIFNFGIKLPKGVKPACI